VLPCAAMVKTSEDLEGYLRRLERRFERLEDGTFLVGMGTGAAPLALRMAPPVLVAQVEIGSAPSSDGERAARIFRKLLELNSSDLMHAAYGLEGASIVLAAALELETCDLNELEAVFADVDLALVEHVPTLREMVDGK
jgi:hypothetical protein